MGHIIPMHWIKTVRALYFFSKETNTLREPYTVAETLNTKIVCKQKTIFLNYNKMYYYNYKQ